MKNEKSLNVLVVEEDKVNAEGLKRKIKANAKVEELSVETIQKADDVLDQVKENRVKPQVIIFSEPALDKMKFRSEIASRIHHIKKINPASEVIILATPAKVDTIIETFRAGAYDVVLKDEHAAKNVVNSIHRFLNKKGEESIIKKEQEMIPAN